MRTSTKSGLDSITGTAMQSKEMIQEMRNMSILYQKQLSKHTFTKTFK